jgi:hypothetical protein
MDLKFKRFKIYTLANSVFPVPGGPCIRRFRNKPLFDLVFLVETAISLRRSSRDGFNLFIFKSE